MAKEMMMVPTSDYNNLVNYYKSRITESTLLNKAGRLAAERHKILADPTIPDSVALAMTKPKAKELSRLTKRIRTGGRTHGTTVTRDKDEDDDAMLVSPLENKLDKILRATEKTLKQQPPTPLVPPTRRRKLPKTPKKQPVKPEQASTSKKESGWISSMKHGALKGLGQSMGVNVSRTSDTDSDDEGATRQKKRNPPPKRSNGCVRLRDGKILRKANNSGELSCQTTRRRRRTRTKSKNQAGGSLDVQKWLGKTGLEFHWPGYQYTGPGTHLKKRLARGDPGINRLDKIAKIHDIDYSRAKTLEDKWKADKKMVKAIDNLPGRNTPTEFIVKHIMNTKRKLKL